MRRGSGRRRVQPAGAVGRHVEAALGKQGARFRLRRLVEGIHVEAARDHGDGQRALGDQGPRQHFGHQAATGVAGIDEGDLHRLGGARWSCGGHG
jgi:hypothetical protein